MPTALELGPEGWKPYIEAARRRRKAPSPPAIAPEERARLLARVQEAARVLNLIDPDMASDSLRRAIEEYGIEL